MKGFIDVTTKYSNEKLTINISNIIYIKDGSVVVNFYGGGRSIEVVDNYEELYNKICNNI